MKRSSRKGFTLIELIIGIVIAGILLLAIAFVTIQMMGGLRETAEFSEVTGRVDIIRQLTFDARAADRIVFPLTDGASGAYSSGGVSGQQMRLRVMSYDPVTDVTTPTFVQWASAGSASATEVRVTRASMVDGNDNGLEDDGGYTVNFGQDHISKFGITRIDASNIEVGMYTTFGEESVESVFGISLRNVR
jgi:prepilin-type N-terminal cleavage/methylation domain-containing protein